MAKLVFVSNKNKWLGKLTKLFTGSYVYHCGWLADNNMFYDMNLLRRRRTWPRYGEDQVELFEIPEITDTYLEFQLTHDTSKYGYVDYLLFALRPLYHLVGLSTRNVGGQICSEMCNIDMLNNGVKTPFRATDESPSPADLHRWCISK